MKKIYLILFIAVTVINACQQTPKIVPVDINAEKAAIDSMFARYISAYYARDVAAMFSFITEDALGLGTDQSEFWDKKQYMDLWKQMFADSSAIKFNYINERVIRVATDGKSAIVVEQYMFPLAFPKIPMRDVYYLVKTNDKWMIDFVSSSLIPKNEDIAKLNDALN